jgi:hypothetical protein
MQMPLADVVECAVNAALQQGEGAFDRVGMDITPHVFLFCVIYGFMASKWIGYETV